MASIETRTIGDGAKRYRVKVRLAGARTISKTFVRRTDAKQWAQQTEAAIRRGQYFQTQEATRHILAEAIDRYRAEVLPRKPRTAKVQSQQLGWWRAELGHLRMADITATALADARTRLLHEPSSAGRARSAATANRYMAAISHLLSVAAREWEWIETNPARKLTRLKEPRGRERFLSKEECIRLLTACRELSHPHLHDVVLLAISTGMRRGEILTLRRDQIDIDRRRIYLYDTKNGERRGVILAGPALSALAARIQLAMAAEDLLFPGAVSTSPFDLRKPWYGALRRAGLSGLRFHDLRHTAASLLAKNRESLIVIGSILGHKTPSTTKRYAHLTDSYLETVVSSMNDTLFDQTRGCQ